MLPILDTDYFSREPALLADALREHGVCWIAGWPDAALHDALREDLLRLQSGSDLIPAAVGRRDGRTLRNDIRADTTCWLDNPRCGDAAGTLLARFDAIRTILNRTLFLGLTSCEAHYAAYPSGGGYARHRDCFRDSVSSIGSTARVVSWVTYLNPEWGADDGGALRIFLDDDIIELPPSGGSICFMSELEHEVLPSSRERFSIAGWFRRPDNAVT